MEIKAFTEPNLMLRLHAIQYLALAMAGSHEPPVGVAKTI